MAETARLFIALELPPAAVEAIGAVQQALQEGGTFPARLTKPDRLHLTLKFLGEQPLAEVELIADRLTRAAHSPVPCRLAGLGSFGKRPPRVLWVGLAGEGIDSLHETIDDVLAPAFERDDRFTAHVTIGRFRRRVPKQRQVLDRIAAQPVEPVAFTASEFLLKRSTLTPQGPLYETIRAYPLKPDSVE